MKPFSTHITQSNLKATMIMVGLPFIALLVGIGWIVQDSPATSFNKYQEALSTSDWEAVLALSDENTVKYIESLRVWLATAEEDQMYQLSAFDQFLVLKTRFENCDQDISQLSQAELFGIWMKALDVRNQLLKTKIMNQYYFGGTAIGQLFNTRTHSNTGMKFRMNHEDGWKVDAIALMRGYYEASSFSGFSELPTEIEPSEGGYLSRHPSALDNAVPERHTL